MMEVLARNYTRNIDKVNAFEIGNTFVNNTTEDDVLPYEQYALCIGMYGKDEDFLQSEGRCGRTAARTGHQECDVYWGI